MANFDLIGAVSFRKGCYPGQEIVARMQYRGGLKRRMALVHLGGDAAPAPGRKRLQRSVSADQAAGTIANAAPSPDGGSTPSSSPRSKASTGATLHLKSPQGPALTVLSRPPVDAAS
jgi:folate-binding Fe-S cluster repair protein YgfZ